MNEIRQKTSSIKTIINYNYRQGKRFRECDYT